MPALTLVTKEGTIALIPGTIPMITIAEKGNALGARIFPDRLCRFLMVRMDGSVSMHDFSVGRMSSSTFNNRCLLRLESGPVVVRATITKPLRDQLIAWLNESSKPA